MTTQDEASGCELQVRAPIKEGARAAVRKALHLIYPPQCVACDEMVTSDFALCGACWRDTPFITGLVCNQCGHPLPGDAQDEEAVEAGSLILQCDACLQSERPWARGRAALAYEGRARDLILQLKRADRSDLARTMGAWLHRAAAPLLQENTLIAPVPLHWRRMFRRRYNQAALLSAQLAKRTGAAHCPDLLVRTRHTQRQDGLDLEARFTNLQGALAVKGARRRLAGRPVLLVDDVMTSGATLSSAARACLESGAQEVSVLVLGRATKSL